MPSTRTNSDGYQRINGGPDRDKYLHRVAMEKLLGCTDPDCAGCGRRAPIPQGLTVHHQDFRRNHNCPGNLVLLSWPLNVLAGEIKKAVVRDKRGRWKREQS